MKQNVIVLMIDGGRFDRSEKIEFDDIFVDEQNKIEEELKKLGYVQ